MVQVFKLLYISSKRKATNKYITNTNIMTYLPIYVVKSLSLNIINY